MIISRKLVLSLLCSSSILGLLSCNNNFQQNENSLSEEPNELENSNVLGVETHDLLFEYISKVEPKFGTGGSSWLYYNVLIHEKQDSTFITLWTFVSCPSIEYLKVDFTEECGECLHFIEDRKVVFIYDLNKDYPSLFTVSELCKKNAVIEKNKEDDGPTHDYDWYIETYFIKNLVENPEFIQVNDMDLYP